MRVVVFSFSHYDNVLSYANAIAKYTDIDITVVVIAGGNRIFAGTFEKEISNFPGGIFPGDARVALFPDELQKYFEPNLKILFMRLAAQKVSAKKPHTLLASIINLFKLAIFAKRNYDVFHFNGAGFYSLILSYLIRTKSKILTIHDYVSHTGEEDRLAAFFNARLVRNFKHFIQHYDYLSEAMAKYYGLDVSQVHTVRSGTFDLFKQFSPEDPARSGYMLFFGRISPYKGLTYLIDAFAQYCKDYHDLDLVIAGGGSIKDVKAAIESNPRISIINREISVNELAGLVQNCRFVMCPYVDATHSAVVMVSYAYGKPVLAHNVGGLNEVIIHKETGLLFDDLKVDTIIGSIHQITSDKSLEESMHKNIISLCEFGFLSWKKISNDYKNVYLTVLNTNKPGKSEGGNAK